MLVAATGLADRKTEKDFREIQDARWDAVPERKATLRFGHTVFKTISRGGAYHHHNFTTLHQEPPFPLFPMVNDPNGHARVVVEGFCEERWDPYMANL